ncbi:hypothetical protein JAAARDRAFT_399869 [Jaapia argillacea MUCL 33604]|uniref:Uncharacterized protein n=1 Tax=Jaapia argillacea MUCL 33604 TaxID=933084 RepID=A0A067PI76_9AGAM|nr:hypothetical protein JAAARDRAFT_399869 [Jaapia argillacea MUCL 33604]
MSTRLLQKVLDTRLPPINQLNRILLRLVQRHTLPRQRVIGREKRPMMHRYYMELGQPETSGRRRMLLCRTRRCQMELWVVTGGTRWCFLILDCRSYETVFEVALTCMLIGWLLWMYLFLWWIIVVLSICFFRLICLLFRTIQDRTFVVTLHYQFYKAASTDPSSSSPRVTLKNCDGKREILHRMVSYVCLAFFILDRRGLSG